MTPNQAAYYRFLFLNGFPEELTNYIDHALETENPLSDLTLDLSLCFSDTEKMLNVLNEYISNAKPEEIDWDGAILNMVLEFLRSKSETLSTEELVLLMKDFALTDELYTLDRWYSVYIAHEYYDECLSGIWNFSMNDFLKDLHAFLQFGTPIILPRP